MGKIVVIYAHPMNKASLANKTLLEEFKKQVPDAEIVNLNELYPDYKIDAGKEQARLKDAEMIIFEYPFWWYAAPSLLHAYIEQVFTHGWAYGAGGDALKGKNLTLSFTVGGYESDYQRMHGTHHPIEQYLPTMLSTAAFTGMIYRGAVYSFEMMPFDKEGNTSPEMKNGVIERAREQASRLIKHIGQFIAVK